MPTFIPTGIAQEKEKIRLGADVGLCADFWDSRRDCASVSGCKLHHLLCTEIWQEASETRMDFPIENECGDDIS
jgi:hypothetical protein